MITIGIILFLLIIVLQSLDNKISLVHLTKLQNIDQTAHGRTLKSLAYRRTQSLFVIRLVTLVFVFSFLYIISTQMSYVVAGLVVLACFLTGLFISRSKLLNLLTYRLMPLLDKLIRRYDKQLLKFGKKFFPDNIDQKIYKPYDDKEFKKLINSLHSSDNLVNKKVLSKIDNLFKLQYVAVEDIMVPMNKVMVIDEDEYIGPILLDELHKTSLTIFPVGSDGKIIGSVNLSDMKDQTGKTKVRDVAKHEVNYIQEDTTVEGLIEVFVEYKSEQFLVIDSKENLLGVVNIYQMIELLFDQHTEKV